VRTSPKQLGAGSGLGPFGELHGNDAMIAPRDAAWADLGIKKGNAAVRHDGSF
jgi:hypothetical protein